MYEMIIGATHLGSVDGNEVGEVGTGMRLGIYDEGVEVKEDQAKLDWSGQPGCYYCKVNVSGTILFSFLMYLLA